MVDGDINTWSAPSVAADDAGPPLQTAREVVAAAGRQVPDCRQADGKVGCSWHHNLDYNLVVILSLFVVHHHFLQCSESLPFKCWLVSFWPQWHKYKSIGIYHRQQLGQWPNREIHNYYYYYSSNGICFCRNCRRNNQGSSHSSCNSSRSNSYHSSSYSFVIIFLLAIRSIYYIIWIYMYHHSWSFLYQ